VQLREKTSCRSLRGARAEQLRYLDLIESSAVDYVQMDVVCQAAMPPARDCSPTSRATVCASRFIAGGRARSNRRGAPGRVLAGECRALAGISGVFHRHAPLYVSVPARSEILKTPLQIERGELVVPRGPGLGSRSTRA